MDVDVDVDVIKLSLIEDWVSWLGESVFVAGSGDGEQAVIVPHHPTLQLNLRCGCLLWLDGGWRNGSGGTQLSLLLPALHFM